MRIEYSKRAVNDLAHIAAFHVRSGNPNLAKAIAERVEEVIGRIAVSPLLGRPVVQRPGVRVALLARYRYKIFYRVAGDVIRIAHIRHTSRRPYD